MNINDKDIIISNEITEIPLELSVKDRIVYEACPNVLLGSPPRTQLGKEVWSAISKKIREGKQCAICGKPSKDAHEQYQYYQTKIIHKKYKKKYRVWRDVIVQKLVNIIPVCENCHLTIHYSNTIHEQLKQQHKQKLEYEIEELNEIQEITRGRFFPDREKFEEYKQNKRKRAQDYKSNWDWALLKGNISYPQPSEINDNATKYFDKNRGKFIYGQDFSYLDRYLEMPEIAELHNKFLQNENEIERLWKNYHKNEKKCKALNVAGAIFGCLMLFPLSFLFSHIADKTKEKRYSIIKQIDTLKGMNN